MNLVDYISMIAKKYVYLHRLDSTDKNVIDKSSSKGLERYVPYEHQTSGGVEPTDKIGTGKFFEQGKNKIPFSFKGSGKFAERRKKDRRLRVRRESSERDYT